MVIAFFLFLTYSKYRENLILRYTVWMNRQDLRERELGFLAQEKEKYPHLFKKQITVDDNSFLSDYGIYIPGKNRFPRGFVKTLPSDFIVEEVSSSGVVHTIDWPLEKKEMETGLKSPHNEKENFSTLATLVKCGVSTIEAVEDMNKRLDGQNRQTDASRISYAGIKDKDAVTSQAISFRNIYPESVEKLISTEYFVKDIRLGKGILAKGDLQKNKFTILVRTNDLGKDGMVDIIARQVKDVQQNGFYNYYYLQRFGNPRLINFVWGIHIIKGEYRQATEHYLSYAAPRELEYFRNIREKISRLMGNWDDIVKLLDPFTTIFTTELKIVTYLRAHPTDYLGALLTVPEQILLWVYAVPSLLFNVKISTLLQHNQQVPSMLPLVLSDKQSDIDAYREELQSLGLYPLRFEHLRPFRNIFIKSRLVPTRERVEFHGFNVIKEGVVLSFSLGKGEYATTLLSHIFNLSTADGNEAENDVIDCKALLGDDGSSKTLDFFASIINQYKEKEKE